MHAFTLFALIVSLLLHFQRKTFLTERGIEGTFLRGTFPLCAYAPIMFLNQLFFELLHMPQVPREVWLDARPN